MFRTMRLKIKKLAKMQYEFSIQRFRIVKKRGVEKSKKQLLIKSLDEEKGFKIVITTNFGKQGN